jgi:exosortase E/protease (VPEID-CTERM system)
MSTTENQGLTATAAIGTRRGTVPLTLAGRVGIAAVVLTLEKFVLSFLVDFTSAAQGLRAAVHVAQHWGFRFLVSLLAAVLLFSFLRGGAANAGARGAPIRWRWLLLHGALVAPLIPLSMFLYDHASSVPFALVAAGWLIFALAASLALLAALAPAPIWRAAVRSLGVVWWYAGVAAALATAAMAWSESWWAPMANVTFHAVASVLKPLVPGLEADPATLTIAAGRFAVNIAPACSGLEGVGLMLAFCSVLLLLFRREYIFPRALMLLPAGVALSLALNVVRIASLVLIGYAGYPDVAAYGFHSEAGWIAFNGAAVLVAILSRRSPWLSRAAREPSGAASRNPTALYLLPFLAILLTGMLSAAVSSGFEYFYGLRLVAAMLALAYCWPRLHGLDWRFSWRGPATGIIVFGLWIGAAHFLLAQAPMPAPLLDMPRLSRGLWIAARLAGSLVAAPLAEELAFRGYLLRRLKDADFEAVSPASTGVWPLIASSVAFGLLHGTLWLPGIAAGFVYGFMYMRTGRIGEAVAAHGATNALLAGSVLAGAQWQLW